MSDTPARTPTTHDEVRHLVKRLRLEIGVTNALGIAILLAGAVLFPAPGDDTVGVAIPVIAVLAVAIALVAVAVSHRLVRPLTAWLELNRVDEDAPPDV
ncbi:MAG TPA: hypothetical protein VM618_03695, partial [Acidimicrobiia bacterium]|nr:hypothetical protein [Acidimicrobiia bacterium]